MNVGVAYSSLLRAQKQEKLMDLIERRKSGKRPVPKERDATNIKSCEKGCLKRKKLNVHFYKKLFQIRRKKVKVLNDVSGTPAVESCPGSKRKRHGKKVRVWNDVNDTPVEESCSGFRRKKHRLCYVQRCGESVHLSGSKDKIQSGSNELADNQFEVSTETHNHIIPYVNKLLDHRNRGQNAVLFDGPERVVKVVSFVSSLLDNTMKPILIIAASSSAISLWETEFSKWPKSGVTYIGGLSFITIRDSEFQVVLSSLDAIAEDLELEMLDNIKWELLVIDESQCPVYSTHLNKFQKLMTDMKLLTVTGESEDILQSYRNILSLVDCKNEKIQTVDADMEMNDDINTLKERLSPFTAFECTFSTPDLDEYCVPVHLSSMQIKQYCSILASNSDTLSSSSRKSPLRDILTQIQKCCDHPFLADPTLRNSSKEGSLIDDDPLAAEINVSGKLQVLDKLLLEIKQCGLRALILFHTAVNSEKISTGHFLDDLVHQRFGPNSYIHIPVNSLNSANLKKRELLEKFNNAESESCICLCDYRACHSSIRLSHLDVVILFNSDHNPSNDIRALKRITIDPHRDRLHVFRFYSAFTVEEKALILSHQGTPVDSHFRWRVCHRLLGWGASYLFSKLESCTDSRPQSLIDDLVHEMSSLLRNTGLKSGPTKCSIISRVLTPAENILLFGETENLTKESSSIDDYLIDNRHSVFWNKLVKESQPEPEKLCNRLSRRVQKSSQNRTEDVNATSASFVRSKPRSKRKLVKNVGRKWAGPHTPFGTHQACEITTPSTALNTGMDEGQQSQTEQPPPHTLETEIERIQKEREKIAKSHQEKESMLLAECEKEISKVRMKYDGLIHDSKTRSTNEDINLEEYEKLVSANKLLAEILSQHWQDTPILKKAQKETSTFNILTIPASALVRPRNLCLTRGPTTYIPGHSLAGSGVRFAAPHLRSNPSLFASLHNRPATGEPSVNKPSS